MLANDGTQSWTVLVSFASCFQGFVQNVSIFENEGQTCLTDALRSYFKLLQWDKWSFYISFNQWCINLNKTLLILNESQGYWLTFMQHLLLNTGMSFHTVSCQIFWASSSWKHSNSIWKWKLLYTMFKTLGYASFLLKSSFLPSSSLSSSLSGSELCSCLTA